MDFTQIFFNCPILHWFCGTHSNIASAKLQISVHTVCLQWILSCLVLNVSRLLAISSKRRLFYLYFLRYLNPCSARIVPLLSARRPYPGPAHPHPLQPFCVNLMNASCRPIARMYSLWVITAGHYTSTTCLVLRVSIVNMSPVIPFPTISFDSAGYYHHYTSSPSLPSISLRVLYADDNLLHWTHWNDELSSTSYKCAHPYNCTLVPHTPPPANSTFILVQCIVNAVNAVLMYSM